MLKSFTAASLLALTATAIATAPSHAEAREVLPNISAIGARRELPPRVLGNAGPSRTGSSNLSYHNGPVMTNAVVVVPIYWGSSWGNGSNAFSGDKITGLTTFYNGYGNSNYAKISQQLTQTGGAKTSIAVSQGTPIIDTSTASSTKDTLAQKVVDAVGFANLSENNFYPVYTDLPRGSAGYCAWHSYASATVGGVTKIFKYAFFWSHVNDSGCTSSSGSVSYSTVTQSLASVSAHELTEAMTDPLLNAWYDKRGYENADKCAWQFNGVQTLSNGSVWQIQGNWSNSAGTCVWG